MALVEELCESEEIRTPTFVVRCWRLLHFDSLIRLIRLKLELPDKKNWFNINIIK